jgi:hypothetical protein
MQKHNFDVTFLGALFLVSASVPPEHEKFGVDVSRPGCTRTHYVTRGSHEMQKQKFYVTCPGVLFMVSSPGPPEHEK